MAGMMPYMGTYVNQMVPNLASIVGARYGYRHPMANNLKALRLRAGLTQPQLAAMMGTTKNQLVKLEKGTRRLDQQWIERAASALDVRLEAIIADDDRAVPVVGQIGAGSQIFPIDDCSKGASLDEVELPFPVEHGTVAVIVRGDSMFPKFEDGDLIGYMREGDDPNAVIGELCIVKLRDGRVLVKRLKRGSSIGRFTLSSFNAPDIEDVEIEWAARYRFALPAKEWRRMARKVR